MSVNLPYYHGAISHAEAENILEGINTPGSFLIRNSETMSGSYTLCLWAEDGYHQYRIINEGDGLFVKAEVGVEEIKYPSLAHLIDYYQNQCSTNGLAAPLRQPVPVNSMEALYDLKKSTDVKEILAFYFQHKFRYERNFRFNTSFYYIVERYLETGLVSDLEDIQQEEHPSGEITHFRKLVFEIMKTLYESVTDVLNKLTFLNSFFGNSSEEKNFNLNLDSNDPGKFAENLECLKNLPSVMKKVEASISSILVQRLNSSNSHQVPNGLSKCKDSASCVAMDKVARTVAHNHLSSPSSTAQFEIEFCNSEYHSLQVQCTAYVDIVQSTVRFELRHTVTGSAFKEISLRCDAIEQLLKNEGNPQRLHFCQRSSSAYFYIDFASEASREEFVHCLYGAKKYQDISLDKPCDCLSVFVGTWNIGSNKPSEGLMPWLKCQGSGSPLLSSVSGYVPHDVYVIAIQEDSVEYQWDSIIRTCLNSCFNQDFSLISTKANSFPKTLKLSIFCRSVLEKHIRNVTIDTINTGFANTCGNKGAVSISFTYQDASLCFINCHLASGSENAKKREEEFGSILQRLHMNRDRKTCADILQKHDFTFCMGDLNMRTDKHVTEAMKLLQGHEAHTLLQSDEMVKYHRAKFLNPFKSFKEPPILHGPTYRYLKGTRDNLDPFKKRIGKPDKINAPSWCDRVLYKARRDNSIYPLSYGIHLDNKSSDHKPVFSSFILAMPTRDYLSSDSTNAICNIRIDEILLKVSSEWRTKMPVHIQLEGPLLGETYLSLTPNAIAESPDSKILVSTPSRLVDLIKILDLNNNIGLLFLNPFKTIVLTPGLSQRDIESNALSVSVLVTDSRTECIANTVIPLNCFSTSQSHFFEVQLYEHGGIVGSMIVRGSFNHRELEEDDNKYPRRLIDIFAKSYINKESKTQSRSLFDLINEKDTHEYESKRFSRLMSNHDENSAFRPIQSEKVCAVQTVKNISSIPNNLHNHFRKVNGMNFSNTVRVRKNKCLNHYNGELQNLSDDSCETSKCCFRNMCQSNSYRGITMADDRKDGEDDSTLMMVHNESYSTTMIRGGVSTKKRNMDARVDLSKLEADIGIMQPPLPPRFTRKNIRPAKARQEHSNPISMASSSGSSCNANSIGESSAASAEPSCCFINQDSEFEDPQSDGGYRKSQNSHARAQTSLTNSKEAIRTDNSSKQSTITGSSTLICPLSGHYVQAIPTTSREVSNEDRFIEPYASTQIVSTSEEDSRGPERQRLLEIEYVMLQRPLDIKDWLGNLSIPQASVDKMLTSQFRTLEAVVTATEEDLRSLGISDLDTRRRIISGAASLIP